MLKLSADAPVGILIRRVEFDHALVKAAVAMHARLQTGFEITQVTQDDAGVTLQEPNPASGCARRWSSRPMASIA